MKLSRKNRFLTLIVTASIVFSNVVMASAYNFQLQSYKVGTRHQDVVVIQQQLINGGYLKISKPTNYYGTLTAKAVKDFQKTNGLVADGVAGKGTISRLFEKSSSVSTNRGISTERVVSEKITTTDLNMRSGASANYSKVLTIRKSSKVSIISETGGWSKVMYSGKIGYVSSKYLVSISSSQPSSRGSEASSENPVALDWWTSARYEVPRGATFVVEDYTTGVKFNITRTYGTNHAVVEAVSAGDSQKIKQVWGGFNWNRRPVIVHYQGKQIIASMSAMPHAGRDDMPTNKTVSNRSGGYGTGINLDTIHGNGMSGHMDIHFLNSTRHKDGKIDTGHQNNIKFVVNDINQ